MLACNFCCTSISIELKLWLYWHIYITIIDLLIALLFHLACYCLLFWLCRYFRFCVLYLRLPGLVCHGFDLNALFPVLWFCLYSLFTSLILQCFPCVRSGFLPPCFIYLPAFDSLPTNRNGTNPKRPIEWVSYQVFCSH